MPYGRWRSVALRCVHTRCTALSPVLNVVWLHDAQLTAGSVMAKQERIVPSSNGWSQRRFCSSVPYLTKISMLAVSGAEQLNTYAMKDNSIIIIISIITEELNLAEIMSTIVHTGSLCLAVDSTHTVVGLFRLLVRRSGTHCQMNSEIRRVMSTASNSSLKQSCSALTSVTSALEVIFNVMRSINPRFNYLLTL